MNKNVIVNADDFGYSSEVNEGIMLAIKMGIISRTTLMVNMPFCDEAVKLSKAQGYWNSVGLHLNLTEGCPLSEDIKHTEFCKDGVFWKHVHAITRKRSLTSFERDAVKIELLAQIEKFKSFTPPPYDACGLTSPYPCREANFGYFNSSV